MSVPCGSVGTKGESASTGVDNESILCRRGGKADDS